MYNSTLLYNKQTLRSVISDCNLVEAFNQVISYFDPNKGENRKTKVLDCSYSQLWSEKDMRLYSISQTKNLTGNAANNKFDVVVYEPQRNPKFIQDASKFSKSFIKLLKPEGFIIVKTNDFKEKGVNKLQGTFEVQQTFIDAGFYLQDNIVYFHKVSNTNEAIDRVNIVHSNFLIFKMETNKEKYESPNEM